MFVLLLSNYSVFETEAETTRTTLHQIEPHTARHHSLTLTRKARPPPALRSPPFSLSLPDVDPLLCSTLLFSISGDCFQFQEEKFNGGRKIKKQYHESDGVRMPSKETMVAKRAKVDLLHQYDIKQAHVAEIEPRKTQRSAVEMPSSFSEDDKNAETGYNLQGIIMKFFEY